MGPVAIIAGIGLAVSAASAYVGYKQQKKAAKFQRRAAAAQRAQDNLRAARERSEAIRNARLSAGVVSQNAANQGVSGSSAALGGLGSIESQLNQGLSFLDGYNRLSDQAGKDLTKANRATMAAGTAAAVGQLGQQLFSAAGSLGGGK